MAPSWIYVWVPTECPEIKSPVTHKTMINMVEDVSPMEVMKTVLSILQVKRFIQQEANDGYTIFQFQTDDSEDVETALITLQRHGIGSRWGTSISVVPASIHIQQSDPVLSKDEDCEPPLSDTDASFETNIKNFYSSIKSRLIVAEVVSRIRSGSCLTFDYLALLILSATISFLGLIENSSVVLVASMLVSPLMGPIMAGVFGTVIADKTLRNMGIKTEIISLCICIFIGFFFGIFLMGFIHFGWYSVPEWPTPEMRSRGELRSLLIGILIAIPSGAGVALSVLGGNSGSLVGVAISASLLPPAVNAGLFWAIGFLSAVTGHCHFRYAGMTCGIGMVLDSKSTSQEAAQLGAISLALTILNIICIIMTGIAILKLKEVTPDKIPQTFSNFWKRDVKAHREYYKTVTKDSNLFHQVKQVLGIINQPEEEIGLEGTFIQSMYDKAYNEADFINIRNWIATPPASTDPVTVDTGTLTSGYSHECSRPLLSCHQSFQRRFTVSSHDRQMDSLIQQARLIRQRSVNPSPLA